MLLPPSIDNQQRTSSQRGFSLLMDGQYYARLASEGKRFAYLPEILAAFLHAGSISQRHLNAKELDGILRTSSSSPNPPPSAWPRETLIKGGFPVSGIRVDGIGPF